MNASLAPAAAISSTPYPAAPTRLWLPAYTLAVREVVRFFRQRTRVVGALVQPMLFWILFGAGLQGSFQAPAGVSYYEFFLPGVAVMIVLFTAIFSTISIIEDRREGFLQGVLAAPASRLAIVLGKVGGGTVIALIQAFVFLLIGPACGALGLIPPITSGLTWINLLPVIGFLLLLGVGITALGYLIAWPMDSTHGFHAIMSVFLLPMWLLSGSFFPAKGAIWLAWIIRVNPMTYGVAGLRHLMATNPEAVKELPSFPVCLGVSILFAIVCVAISVWETSRPSAHNTR